MGLRKIARTLTGKKTNAAAGAAIVGAAVGVATGKITKVEAAQFVLTSALAIFLRDGIKTTGGAR